jgi:hypothetical protein
MMPTPTDPTHLVKSLESQVNDLTEQLKGALGLLHSAAISRHYALHTGYFTECREAKCREIRERLGRFCPPGTPAQSTDPELLTIYPGSGNGAGKE